MKRPQTYWRMLLMLMSFLLVACTEKEETSKERHPKVAEAAVKTFLLYRETSTSEEYGSAGDLYIKTFTSENEKIASNVLNDQYYYDESNDTVLFLTSENNLYRFKKGTDKEKIASNVHYFSGNLSNKYIFYQNDDGDLYIIDESLQSEKIASSVSQIDMVDTDLYYVNYDGDLKLFNIQSREEKTIASDVTYFKRFNKDGDLIYTNDDYMLFYKQLNKEAVRISGKEVNTDFITKVDDGFIYLANEEDEQHLYKTSVDGTETEKIASDVISFSLNQDNIVYLTFDDNLFLNLADKDSALKLASDVHEYYIAGNKIYFKNQNNSVYAVSKDGKKSELSTNVENLKIANDGTLVYENNKSELFIANKKVATDLDDFALFEDNIAYATKDDQLHFIENFGESIVIEQDLSKYSIVTYQNEVIFSNYLTFSDISGEWKVQDDDGYSYITISTDGLIISRYTNSSTAMELIHAGYNHLDVLLNGENVTIELSEDRLIFSNGYDSFYLERLSLQEIAELYQIQEDANLSEVTSINVATLDSIPYPGSLNTNESAREQIETLLSEYLIIYTSLDLYNLDTTVYTESDFYNTQTEYMNSLYNRGILLDLVDYSVIDLKQLSESEFNAVTKEHYTIYYSDGTEKKVTQTTAYTIHLIDGEFYITNLRVL